VNQPGQPLPNNGNTTSGTTGTEPPR